MERKIGEIFEYNGEWYQCVKGDCTKCDFFIKRGCVSPLNTVCGKRIRKDKQNVIFKKLEKVGEPYSCNYYGDNRLIMMQEYNLFNLDDVTNEDKIPMYITDYKHKRIAIEIKETKEDMEGKYKAEDTPLTRLVGRYVNNLIDYEAFDEAVKELYSDKEESKSTLKEFDLEVAKAGKPVCTRDGHKARIICFDAKSSKPVIALITRKSDDYEEGYSFYEDGRACGDKNNDYDLMMLSEKKEGWVNVYKDTVYDTKDEALIVRSESRGYIDTIKINWEE